MNHIRHGDVLLVRVDSIPSGQIVKHDGQYILAYGEVTGHAHRLSSKEKDELTVIRYSGVTYISLASPAPLTHEEHKQLEIPSGKWKLVFEREYDPFLTSIRKVQD